MSDKSPCSFTFGQPFYRLPKPPFSWFAWVTARAWAIACASCQGLSSIRKTWKCNIIWFNPPYSKLLKTNIGKYFFRLLNKHFPPGHKLYKVFNNNTLKLSYSCMSNLKAKIDGHNKKILKTTPPPKTKLCNCLKKEKWTMRGACLTENLLYYARISSDNQTY